MSISLSAFSELPWEEGRAASGAGVPPGSVVRRKWLARGQAGLFAQHVQMPPGNVVQTHSHSRDELMVVLRGGCRFDERVDLGPGDSAVVPADARYGFVVGGEGMEFLIVRTGEAVLTRADP
jgi:quercetin dioxygenase-like cupin family protein